MISFRYLVALLISVRHAVAYHPTVRIDSGDIIGKTKHFDTTPAAVNQFLGIPFAESPPKRFTPPQPPKAWNGPLRVQAWKPSCIQQFNYPAAARAFTMSIFNNYNPQESEDCLYLNVYAPSTPAPPCGRAVMFWIYGGGFQFGSAGQPYYDGSYFAAYEDVVVVTTNYRTNVFGFPSSPEIPSDQRNLGLLDQRAALQWVQRNIHQFGGDPSKVTIFGESAGAAAVDALLTSYPRDSTPPFRAAILQSGQISYRAPASPQGAIDTWNRLATLLNCTGSDNLSCVVLKPALDLKSVIEQNAMSFPPLPDNYTLYSNTIQRRLNHEIAVVPTMSGTNAQEGRIFEFGQNDTDAYLSTLPILTDVQKAAIKAAYPLGSPGLETQYDQLSQIFTEFAFQCSAAIYVNATYEAGIPSWRYLFNATFPNLHPPQFETLGKYHASEIPMVFRTYNSLNGTTAQEDALGIEMQAAWARFAKDPMGGPGWDRIGSGSMCAHAGGADSDLDLGVWQQTGIEVEHRSAVDWRCGLFDPIYQALGWVS